MKIAIFSNTCYETIVPSVKELTLKGHDVRFFALLSAKSRGKSNLFENDAIWQTEPVGTIINDVTRYVSSIWSDYVSYGKWSALFFHNFAFFKPVNWIIIFKIIQIIKKEQYDVLHFNSSSILFILLSNYFKSKRVVFQVHDPESHSGENHLGEIIYRFLLSKCKTSQFILHSTYSFNVFINKFNQIPQQNIKVIPFGPHEWLIKLKINQVSNSRNALFFGRFSPYKGINYLLEAASIIQNEDPTIKITIAGSGSLDFEPNSIPSNVILINKYITNFELIELLNCHQFVVCPYTDATQSGVVQTALMFQKPIIATDVGAMKEMIIHNETGIIIPPRNVKALVKAILEMSREDRYSYYFDNLANNQSNSYSWHDVTEQFIKVYN